MQVSTMRFSLFVILVLLVSACGSDRILCPKTGKSRLKQSTVNPEKVRRIMPETNLTSSIENKPNLYRYRYVDIRMENKNQESVEEWDCPRPGSRKSKKAAREYLKKQEKKIRYILTDSVQAASTQQ